MLKPINSEFFYFSKPWYPGISDELFSGVKKSYKPHVVEAVDDYIKLHIEDANELANFMQPDLATTLARQRRDYNISEEFEPEFSINDLSEKVKENAPVNNLGIESACGLVGHKVKKNCNLEATSRSIIIEGTKKLREKYGSNLRDFGQAARRVKDLKLTWSRKQNLLAGEKNYPETESESQS
jgi:hypothetical protein